mmetsp:Transcript_18401/g.28224  ORF Transcript_18401/g.28224 Transcript_18401/m.28224 type:complete len:90 (-) Transcript_18401:783-1052(-)
MLKPNDLEKYEREVHVMEEVKHASLARLEHYFSEKDKFYIVMEMCKGKELFRELNERKLEDRRIANLEDEIRRHATRANLAKEGQREIL